MPFGDIGGAVTELIITCRTPAAGAVAIQKGDALKLTGAYAIDNETDDEDALFGQAMADCALNDAALPVKVRGVCIFHYVGDAPTVDGAAGVVASATNGKVKAPAAGNGKGINVKTDSTAGTVHVLL